MFKNKKRGTVGMATMALPTIAALMLSVVFSGGGVQASPASSPKGDGIGSARFTTNGSVTNFSASATTIPYFRSQFTDPSNNTTYAYTMVGTNPSQGNATTTIPTEIIPFKFTFVASADPAVHTLNGADNLQQTIDSPVFQTSNVGAAADAAGSASAPPSFAAGRTVNEPSDVTQLGDAIYRAQWGMTGTGYHVLLGQPTVMPTQSFVVPQNIGQIIVGHRTGADIGLISISWFANRLTETINNLHIDPHTLPIILVNNTFLYIGNPANCCVLGYHGATLSLNGNGKQQVQTYMFASYSSQGIFGANDGDTESYIADIHGLSHEVQEWYDDPFVNNVINPWLTPTAPQYGCTNALETGDPVVGYGFKITMSNGITYHPEDEAHYSWFAREDPSRAEQGYFTYLNNFPSVAQGC